MKNMRSVLARIASNRCEAEAGGGEGRGEVSGSAFVSRERIGRESRSSEMEGKGWQAKGGIGWVEEEKSNGGG
jgi:hypothetical protein